MVNKKKKKKRKEIKNLLFLLSSVVGERVSEREKMGMV